MIYIGEHTLPKEELIHYFQDTINAVNDHYCAINVNGLLLVYDFHFLHVIEVCYVPNKLLNCDFMSMSKFKIMLILNIKIIMNPLVSSCTQLICLGFRRHYTQTSEIFI